MDLIVSKIKKWTSIKQLLKVVSVGLCLLMILPPEAIPQTSQAPFASEKNSTQTISASQILNIPPSIGKVKEFYKGESQQTIIHIQDAHLHYGIQKSISELIDFFVKEHGASLINLEGAEGYLISDSLAHASSQKIREEIANYYIKEGAIGGSEHYALVHDSKVRMFGAEKRALYDDNLEKYREVKKQQKAALEMAASLKSIVEALGQLILPEKNYWLHRYKDQMETDNDYLFRYLETLQNLGSETGIQFAGDFDVLVRLMALQKKIDLERDKSQLRKVVDYFKKNLAGTDLKTFLTYQTRYRLGSISASDYYRYLKNQLNSGLIKEDSFKSVVNLDQLNDYLDYQVLSHELDVSAIDFDALEAEMNRLSLKTENQKTIAKLWKVARISQSLFELTVTKNDASFFFDQREAFLMASIEQMLLPLMKEFHYEGSLPQNLNIYDQSISSAEGFYFAALERDRALIENTVRETVENKHRVSILVTGGFHTAGMSHHLKEENISHVIVTPAAEEMMGPRLQQNLYEKALSGEYSRFELEGRKLYENSQKEAEDHLFQMSAWIKMLTEDQAAEIASSEGHPLARVHSPDPKKLTIAKAFYLQNFLLQSLIAILSSENPADAFQTQVKAESRKPILGALNYHLLRHLFSGATVYDLGSDEKVLVGKGMAVGRILERGSSHARLITKNSFQIPLNGYIYFIRQDSLDLIHFRDGLQKNNLPVLRKDFGQPLVLARSESRNLSDHITLDQLLDDLENAPLRLPEAVNEKDVSSWGAMFPDQLLSIFYLFFILFATSAATAEESAKKSSVLIEAIESIRMRKFDFRGFMEYLSLNDKQKVVFKELKGLRGEGEISKEDEAKLSEIAFYLTLHAKTEQEIESAKSLMALYCVFAEIIQFERDSEKDKHLKDGAFRERVKALQKAIRGIDKFAGDGKKTKFSNLVGTVDGKFGNKTKNALSEVLKIIGSPSFHPNLMRVSVISQVNVFQIKLPEPFLEGESPTAFLDIFDEWNWEKPALMAPEDFHKLMLSAFQDVDGILPEDRDHLTFVARQLARDLNEENFSEALDLITLMHAFAKIKAFQADLILNGEKSIDKARVLALQEEFKKIDAVLGSKHGFIDILNGWKTNKKGVDVYNPPMAKAIELILDSFEELSEIINTWGIEGVPLIKGELIGIVLGHKAKPNYMVKPLKKPASASDGVEQVSGDVTLPSGGPSRVEMGLFPGVPTTAKKQSNDPFEILSDLGDPLYLDNLGPSFEFPELKQSDLEFLRNNLSSVDMWKEDTFEKARKALEVIASQYKNREIKISEDLKAALEEFKGELLEKVLSKTVHLAVKYLARDYLEFLDVGKGYYLKADLHLEKAESLIQVVSNDKQELFVLEIDKLKRIIEDTEEPFEEMEDSRLYDLLRSMVVTSDIEKPAGDGKIPKLVHEYLVKPDGKIHHHYPITLAPKLGKPEDRGSFTTPVGYFVTTVVSFGSKDVIQDKLDFSPLSRLQQVDGGVYRWTREEGVGGAGITSRHIRNGEPFFPFQGLVFERGVLSHATNNPDSVIRKQRNSHGCCRFLAEHIIVLTHYVLEPGVGMVIAEDLKNALRLIREYLKEKAAAQKQKAESSEKPVVANAESKSASETGAKPRSEQRVKSLELGDALQSSQEMRIHTQQDSGIYTELRKLIRNELAKSTAQDKTRVLLDFDALGEERVKKIIRSYESQETDFYVLSQTPLLSDVKDHLKEGLDNVEFWNNLNELSAEQLSAEEWWSIDAERIANDIDTNPGLIELIAGETNGRSVGYVGSNYSGRFKKQLQISAMIEKIKDEFLAQARLSSSA